ncbi:MAG: glycosyltransferase family 4 protein [Candidatus Binatus sp.]|jgi:glycosyltransferase involved in cell wall biosynthesis
MKVVIVAPNASTRFGGEAILPWHYFRLLRKRGVQAWLVVHERTRLELTTLLPDEVERMRFVPDLAAQRWLAKMSKPLPQRFAAITLGWGSGILSSLMQRAVVRDLVRQHGVDVVHEPIPVSPKQPSLMYGVGAPVVIGPMNGGMNYPSAFANLEGRLERWSVGAGRVASNVLNTLIPGKRRAAVLLVANERTRRALPRGTTGEVAELVENGVDLNVFKSPQSPRLQSSMPPKFAFVGRLIEWKGVDMLLLATARALQRHDLELHIIGDGAIRTQLESLAATLPLGNRVVFHGFVPQDQCAQLLAGFDALVLPSLYECGGAVVLEAMAMGLPVIATKWGGPADYLDERTGILIEPTGRESFINKIAEAMVRLAQSPELRHQLGQAARARAVAEFDWEKKIDRILEFYARARQAISSGATVSGAVAQELQRQKHISVEFAERGERDTARDGL